MPYIAGGELFTYLRTEGKLTEEHAQVDVSACTRRPRVGERVTVIPNHVCPVVNLFDRAWWHEEDGSLRPLPIDARGLLS